MNGQSSANLQSKASFKVLSWNIYMLPRFARITGKRQRAHAIAEQLRASDYQVLVLQEAFLGDARRIIRKVLAPSFPHALGPANRKFSIRTNSGIWILSKLPLTYLEEIEFDECAGFDDCMARKGALLVETEFQGRTVQLLGTHLQAGGPHSIRHSQYAEIRALLDRHKREGVPQLICGDMNTNKADLPNYQHMMQVLDALDGPLLGQQSWTADGVNNDFCRGGRNNQKVIDYIFFRGNGAQKPQIRRSIPYIRAPWHRKHQDLSDHFPVEIAVNF